MSEEVNRLERFTERPQRPKREALKGRDKKAGKREDFRAGDGARGAAPSGREGGGKPRGQR